MSSPTPPFFFLFRAMPEAYGSSQARGQIGATSCYPQSQPAQYTAGSELCLQSAPQLTAKPDPRPTKARDQTLILMATSQIHFCSATMGTPPDVFLKSCLQ